MPLEVKPRSPLSSTISRLRLRAATARHELVPFSGLVRESVVDFLTSIEVQFFLWIASLSAAPPLMPPSPGERQQPLQVADGLLSERHQLRVFGRLSFTASRHKFAAERG